MTTQELPIFIALQVAFVENMVPESATAVVSGQLPDLAGSLDAFAKEHQLKYEISTVGRRNRTRYHCWEICSRINSWRWN